MELTLRQMEYFLAVLDTGSMTKAAQKCHASQSATSMAIAQLEKVLGAPLFVRSRNTSLTPTSIALAFAEHARSCVESAEAARAAATETLLELSGALRIGCLHNLARLVLPPLAQQCVERYPHVDLQLLEDSAAQLQTDVRQGRVDLALVYSLQVDTDLPMTRLAEIQLHAMLPTDHPLAAEDTVSWKELAAEPAILLDAPPTVERIQAQAHRLGLSLNIRWALSSMESIRSLVARGLGYSLTNSPPSVGTTADGLEVVYKPLSDDLLPNYICALHAPGAQQLRKVQAALEMIHTTTQNVGS